MFPLPLPLKWYIYIYVQYIYVHQIFSRYIHINYIVFIVQWLLRRLWKLYGTIYHFLASSTKKTWPNSEVMQTIANKAMTIVDSLVWQIPRCAENKLPVKQNFWPKKVPNAKITFFIGRIPQTKRTKTHVSIKAWKLSFCWKDAVCIILLILHKNINTMFQHSVFVFVCTDIEQQEDVV